MDNKRQNADQKTAAWVNTVNVQTYDVTVAPGIDAAFVSAVCVCLDEAYNDK